MKLCRAGAVLDSPANGMQRAFGLVQGGHCVWRIEVGLAKIYG